MRAMFFEKPVVAVTVAASEIGVFARPIGKRGAERRQAGGRATPVSCTCIYTRTRMHGDAQTAILYRDGSPSIFLFDDDDNVGGPGRSARARDYR